MNAAYSLHSLDVVAAPTTNNVDNISDSEEEEEREEAAAEFETEVAEVSNAEKEDNDEDTGSKEGESAEGNVGVMEDDGGEDDGKTDGKEETANEAGEKEHNMDVAGGEEDPWLTRRTWTASLFRQTTDHRTMGQGENEDRPATAGKKKQINKQNNQAHIRKSARISRTPTRY
jgi:hypothetical protein